MNQKGYDRLILKRVENSFNVILLIGGITAILSAAVIYFSETIPFRYTLVNSAMGIVIVGVYVFRKKISIDIKIVIGALVPVLMGFHAFIDGGFNSGAMTLVLLSNAVVVLFLSRKKSLLISGVSVMMFLCLWVWGRATRFRPPRMLTDVVWFMQISMLILFIVLFQITVYTIRRYLMENVAELEKAVDQTYHMAYYDQLTGVLNKNGFLKQVAEAQARRTGGGCMVFISVRNLNMINALFNVQTGDRILADFAGYFRSIAKKGEILGRIGGNEFAMYLHEDERAYVTARLRGMREGYLRYVDSLNVQTRLEFYASYTWVTTGNTVMHYNEATLAMTYAKYHNEPLAVAYDENFKEQLRREEELKDILKKAVDNASFDLCYQAKVSTVTEAVVGVEALARLEVEGYGCVSPGVFVPMIEELDLSVEFGKLIFQKVLDDYQAIRQKYGEQVSVSVNISPTFLMTEGFDDFISREMVRYGMPAERLILEITEQVVINGVDRVNQVLAPARSRGIRISLDDFGTGYSSLNYLSTIMVDEIKVDKTFIDQILVNRKTLMMVETIIQLSARYGLDVVAEGVERHAQLGMLREMSCPVIQGYLFSRPERLEVPALVGVLSASMQ